MKTLFRIIIILLVAALVGGVFYGAVASGSSFTGQTSMSERPGGDFARPDGDGEHGGGGFPLEAIKNLAIISVICAAYLTIFKRPAANKPVLKPTT